MNRASSRSHSVFSMKVECRTTMQNGISKLRYSTLHIVDLAGSERVKSSGATGAALTEATEINKSLTTLGRVISKVCSEHLASRRYFQVHSRLGHGVFKGDPHCPIISKGNC